MKKETREVKVIKSEDVFVADDGTVFHNEEECKKYEQSAMFVVKKQIMGKCLIELPTGYKEQTSGALYFGMEVLFGCFDDYTFYLFCPKTEEDIKLFLQFARLELNESRFERKQEWTKENFPSLEERLLIDDSADWENYRCSTDFNDLKPGKKYIYQSLDGWGSIYETEQFKKAHITIVDTIVKQFAK